jgi:hypothetical protein
MPGFGIYHSGLEILGREYTFAGGEFEGSGVCLFLSLSPSSALAALS